MNDKMRNLILLIVFTLFIGCSGNKKEQKTVEREEKTIYAKYNQSIKGYDIQIKYSVIADEDYLKWGDWLNGDMIIMSEKDTILITGIRSNFEILGSETDMIIDFDSISDGQIFLVDDYLIPDDSENDTPYLESFDSDCNIAPFYFYDVNFDGKDELIKFSGGYGARGRLLYNIYNFPVDTIVGCGIESLEVDGAWRFDRKKERIITDVTCGSWCDIHEIWKWNEKKDSLIILKMIEQLGCVDNLLETCHTVYKDDKIISSDTIIFECNSFKNNYFDESFLYKGLEK